MMRGETMKKIWGKLRRLVSWLMRPVAQEFNFFVVVWLINSSVTLGYLVGCFMYPDNSWSQALRCLALSTAVAYALTAVLHCLRARWARVVFKTVCYSVLLVLQVVYVFLMLNFEMPLGPRILVLLAETNPKEAGEFVSTYFLSAKSLWAYGIDVAIVAAVVVVEWKKRWLQQLASKRWMKRVLAVLLLPLVLCGVYFSHNYVSLARCVHSKELTRWVQGFGIDALDHLSTSFYSMCYVGVSKADIAQAEQVARAVLASEVAVAEPDSLHVVMVMGESYIKSHAALYGYYLNTTPAMQAERDKGNLVVFTDVVTPYNATSQVQKNVFSLNDKGSGEMWYDKPMLPTVLKHAGFNVYFWDNQRNYAKTEMFTITVNAFIYNSTIAPMSYDETSSIGLTFDGNLIADFEKKSQLPPAKYNFYIFHLMGQHVHPVGRYPKKKGFDRFTADSVKSQAPYLNKEKRTYIAQYDNATLYNDAVMKRIFDKWRDKNAVVVYFSDHGDEAYDYRDHCGRGEVAEPNAQLLRCQNDVPMVVWCSDYYIAHHQQLVSQLKAAATRPGMVQDVGTMILRLAGVSTPYYRPERDITSPSYQPQQRIVFDKYDYDEIVRQAR